LLLATFTRALAFLNGAAASACALRFSPCVTALRHLPVLCALALRNGMDSGFIHQLACHMLYRQLQALDARQGILQFLLKILLIIGEFAA
jgi:hypothetical protein